MHRKLWSCLHNSRPRRRRIAYVISFILFIVFMNMPKFVGENDPFVGESDLFGTKESLEAVKCKMPELGRFTINRMNTTPVVCNTERDWVKIQKGTFYIQDNAVRSHGSILCACLPLRRVDDFRNSWMKPIAPCKNGSTLTADVVRVGCYGNDGTTFDKIFWTISRTKKWEKLKKAASKLPSSAMGYNVLMFGYDSISRLEWLEYLPETRKYFCGKLGGILLESYNIVGDGTPQALLPIFTGQTEVELPEVRRGFKGAKPLDRHPWIWKDFEKAGYVTQWLEDMAYVGTFQMRMLGFRGQPVHYYGRPYMLETYKLHGYNRPYCLGSETRHQIFLDWIKELYLAYQDTPKFSFGFHAELTHTENQNLGALDLELSAFLKAMHSSGYLDNTILILMSDHGPRFTHSRATIQGKLEERLPFFAFRFPPSFRERHPVAFANFVRNSRLLSTPFDIHETLSSVLGHPPKQEGRNSRAFSLFDRVPADRSCSQSGIAPHWCACLTWIKIDPYSTLARNAALAVVDMMNNLTRFQRKLCAPLSMGRVEIAQQMTVEPDLLRFKGSKDRHGRVPEFERANTSSSDAISVADVLLQITFVTTPNHGVYEATVRRRADGTIQVNGKEISRVNKYGSQPLCVSDRYPHLRPYCYCKKMPASFVSTTSSLLNGYK